MSVHQLTSGQLIAGRYRVEKEIGRGGIAIVYSAYDGVLKHDVALKLLVPPPAARDSLLHRFRREATILRELHHPNIVRVHDYVEDGDMTFLVMQLIRGHDLQRRVESGAPLSSREIQQLAVQIVSALDAAHQRGILHRDIKPSNILLDEEGVPYLTDFGAAKRDNQSSLITSSGFVGTLSYLSPEVLEGQRPDVRSDLYSLGLTLYFCAEGKLPPLHRTTGTVEPSEAGFSPEHLFPDVMGKIIAKATRRSPSLRFISADEMLAALNEHNWEDQFVGHLRCPLCNAPDLSGDGICQICLAGKRQDEQMTALMLPANLTERGKKQAVDRIARIFGEEYSRRRLAAVLDGQQALLVLPSVAAGGTAAELKNLGLQMRMQPAHSPISLLPRGFQFLTAELCLVSIFAAAKGLTLLGLGGVALAIGGFLLGARLVKQPLLVSANSWGKLSPRIARLGIETSGQLHSRNLRRLWGDILRIVTRALTLTDANVEKALGQGIEALAAALGDAVKRLDQLDGLLDEFENAAHGRAISGDQARTRLESIERHRTALQNRIFRAISMLGQMSATKLSDPISLDSLDAAREAIEEDARLYIEAQAEVEHLLEAPTMPPL